MYNFVLNTRRMTFSALVIAIYIAVLYVTQGISFGPYQIRIATALYGLAFLYPFLVIPLGIANFIANFLFGGLGLIDMVGGCAVGMITTWLIVQIRQRQGHLWLAALPIWWVPALLVSLWLSYLLNRLIRYWSAVWLSVSCRRLFAASCSFRRFVSTTS